MEEKNIRKVLYVILGFVLCMSVMISIICGIFIKQNKDKIKDYKKTEGKCVQVIRREEMWGDELKIDYYALYEYEVEGVKYTIESNHISERERDVDKKDKVILYNPKHPSKAIIDKEKSFTGSGVVFCINAGITLFIAGMIIVYLKHGYEGCSAVFKGWPFVCIGVLIILWNSILEVVWSAIFMGIAIFIVGLGVCIKQLNSCRGIVTISDKVQELKDEVRNEFDNLN